jgi:hypothetical protein
VGLEAGEDGCWFTWVLALSLPISEELIDMYTGERRGNDVGSEGERRRRRKRRRRTHHPPLKEVSSHEQQVHYPVNKS